MTLRRTKRVSAAGSTTCVVVPAFPARCRTRSVRTDQRSSAGFPSRAFTSSADSSSRTLSISAGAVRPFRARRSLRIFVSRPCPKKITDGQSFLETALFYRGIRPAFGYPACPDHSEKQRLFDLLGAERAGLSLTESFAMTPAASVSGLYFANEATRYFSVGRLGRDQVEDYAARKGIPVAEAERWLLPNLAYEPAA